jgi:Protein of unknown function (DUF4236)
MGFKFRRSIKILPGLRLNLSRSGVSANFGVRRANVSVGLRGTFVNASIPGTGVGYRQRIGEGDTPPAETPDLATDQETGRSSVILRILLAIAIIVVIAIIAGSK